VSRFSPVTARVIRNLCDSLLAAGVTTVDVARLRAAVDRSDATGNRSV